MKRIGEMRANPVATVCQPNLAKPTVVSSNEAVSVLGLKLSVNVFFCLFHGDVEISVQTGEDSPVFVSRIQFHLDGSSNDGLEKVRRRTLGNLRRFGGLLIGGEVSLVAKVDSLPSHSLLRTFPSWLLVSAMLCADLA